MKLEEETSNFINEFEKSVLTLDFRILLDFKSTRTLKSDKVPCLVFELLHLCFLKSQQRRWISQLLEGARSGKMGKDQGIWRETKVVGSKLMSVGQAFLHLKIRFKASVRQIFAIFVRMKLISFRRA